MSIPAHRRQQAALKLLPDDDDEGEGLLAPLNLKPNDKPAPVLANVLVILRAQRPVLAFDEMQRACMIKVDGATPRRLTENDVTDVQARLQEAGLTRLSRETTSQAMERVAHDRPYHPIRDYYNSLQWDGTERLPTFLHRYL